MILTEYELRTCANLPGVLRALANHHSVQETMADASDMPECAMHHKNRREELRAEAKRIEEDWER